MILEADELERITRRKRGSAQARMLERLGVPFTMHPDGFPLVSRSALEATLGGLREVDAERTDYQVDIAAIEAHGKTPRHR